MSDTFLNIKAIHMKKASWLHAILSICVEQVDCLIPDTPPGKVFTSDRLVNGSTIEIFLN